MKTFPLLGGTAFTNLDIEDADKLSPQHREAASKAAMELAKHRLIAEIFFISRGQVLALPGLSYDLVNHTVVDVRGVTFFGRPNRTDGR